MFGMGWQELLLVLVIMLLFFGPNKLPALGKSLGKALAGFKQGMKEGAEEADKGLPEDPKA
ncbi:MAG TPA: twin-arginine translocase TatA/TatE family subunit [Elusimicrobiota bacterium]|jgi:sec-independent protein translocase protein TatA|nr:twin-arginine translocase TatA/TatE family subunit [Elusimicrobiota bacterium]HMX42447.1 twin-arginine translocase TatA/TatE family subunit [Elusimicrobiota bacterium]HMX94161.1 twin-arginine translocase TatA/TatE family subunit [Elusimicrobiota bacterium]HMZ26484.1 twin-arginine translocase TatA/TatE family subunit [Elusimicrobiota bacterium]HNA60390.1 twin-arginine translocase TatA/TatE family subunit [Elusimicrobiota bacterium]